VERSPEAAPPHTAVEKPPEPAPPQLPPTVSASGAYQLPGRGSVAVVSYDEKTAADLRKTPSRFADFVQQGLLFTAPSHAAVAVEERHDGLVKVRFLGAGMQGRMGWVRDDQVSRN